MANKNETKYIIALDKALNTFGNERFKKIRKTGLDLEDLWRRSESDIRKRFGKEQFLDILFAARKKIDPDQEIESLAKQGINFVTLADTNYPKSLKEIFSPPVVLYYKGNINVLDGSVLAVVGSRKFTTYGKNATEKIVSGLAEAGYTIVSGMALGIDTFAHETTLKSGGKTVAVLGCGLDKPYPATNSRLFRRIIDSGGAVISEYMPGKPPLPQHFPARNRIISGLSTGLLIVEANIKSGALITARDGLEQNKDIFAVPGPIFSESSKGTNQLLKMGANLVTSFDDIFEYYGFQATPKKSKMYPSNDTEKAIFGVLEKGESHIDQLIKESCLETQLIISTLTLMEIKGKVKNLGGMVYSLN